MLQKNRNLFIIIFLLVSLIGSLFLVFRTTIFLGRASGSASPLVLDNSYLFASPLQAKADGLQKIRLTVFLLDNRGLGIPNLTVTLNHPQSLSSESIQNITDDTGKAVFDITSLSPGSFDISASVGNLFLPQKVKLAFY